MKYLLFIITFLSVAIQASDYIDDSWGFHDFQVDKIYRSGTDIHIYNNILYFDGANKDQDDLYVNNENINSKELVAPTDLHLIALSSHSVKISWQINSSDNTGFKIFRDGELIARITDNSTRTYIDDGLAPNTTYTYEVRATDDEIESQIKAFIPKLDFDKDDVYGNNQVVYVSTQDELQQSINSANAYTTIVLEDGDYKNFNVNFPKAKHHITIKSKNKHGAKLYPKGKDDDSGIYLPQVASEDEMIHDINFIDLEVVGDGDEKEFLFTPGNQYGHYNFYFKNIKMHELYMGLYSGLSSHDWTMDGCEFYNSTYSYMWYMMGYHQSVINSIMYNNPYYSLSIRGCYPPEEKYDYYNHENNIRINSRDSHFLSPNDWTHLIANNTFGSNYNNDREIMDAHMALYYNVEEGERVSEDVYFPPQNVMIFNNAFIDNSQSNKKMLNLMANRGVNNGQVDGVNGLIIKNNFIDQSSLIDSDTDISSVDLSTNHKEVLEDEFGFDDANRDYHISSDSILKDAGVNNISNILWDFENKKRDEKIDVGAYEAGL